MGFERYTDDDSIFDKDKHIEFACSRLVKSNDGVPILIGAFYHDSSGDAIRIVSYTAEKGKDVVVRGYAFIGGIGCDRKTVLSDVDTRKLFADWRKARDHPSSESAIIGKKRLYTKYSRAHRFWSLITRRNPAIVEKLANNSDGSKYPYEVFVGGYGFGLMSPASSRRDAIREVSKYCKSNRLCPCYDKSWGFRRFVRIF